MKEAPVEMYLGVSVREVEAMIEALWGSRVSPSIISDLNQKIFERIEAWRNRALEREYPYVFVDGIRLKRARGAKSKPFPSRRRSASTRMAIAKFWV